ncbi:hypothetical protein [Spiribacter vilamensis]|uniref:Uncharacterized protein n=1 Tax=Spiribacter vilamensis TaxID=531306 RepID=A0A4Q8D0I1_9GAMM|nr:hypothetical protein [Spiribacter vilamensis]RZU98808.1 hypothetical protein EV698_1070 [Spiribacter vilamensis]TVO62172.1 hypothetical protein FPL09_08865 [Spiribacter vilamensis]
MRWTSIALTLAIAGMPLASAVGQSSGDDWGDDPWAQEQTGWQWYGFIEGAVAPRLQNDPAVDNDYTLGETRLQIEGERQFGDYTATLKADAWLDGVEEGGRGDLREANLAGRLTPQTDIRFGRQIITWGTGDLVFLNDLFPKDYVAFFSGRGDDYLKAPTDAVKLSWFGDVNVDFVWMPRATPNRFITGERLSYFSPQAGRRVAAPPEIDPRDRDQVGEDSEFALRLYQTIDGVEYAGYAYHGYDKQPSAFDRDADEAYFPRLSSLGASVRRPLLGGIANLETAYYHGEDGNGRDPDLPNDQWRWLGGYEHEPFSDITLGWQYSLDWTQDHDALIDALPNGQRRYAPDEYRHLLTNRVTWQGQRQDLTLSLFTFYSPSDEDYYFRPRATYRFGDRLTGTAGANLFGGEDDWTFHTQLEDNSNAYFRLRYSF